MVEAGEDLLRFVQEGIAVQVRFAIFRIDEAVHAFACIRVAAVRFHDELVRRIEVPEADALAVVDAVVEDVAVEPNRRSS